MGRALGGETTGLDQLDNIKGFFKKNFGRAQAEQEDIRESGGDSCLKQVVECSGRQSLLSCLDLCECRTDFVKRLRTVGEERTRPH